MDRVFFSCAACHVGRVMVSGKMQFLAGMPNTEIEAQYYSKLLMLTGAALVESGLDPASTTPVNPASIKPNTSAVRALYAEMLDKASAAGNAMRLLAGANRTWKDSDPGGCGPVGSIRVSSRRRREDALHLVVGRNNAYQQPPTFSRDRQPDGCLRHRVESGRNPHTS
jgi:hypothetical protein